MTTDSSPSPPVRQGPAPAGLLTVAIIGICAAAYWRGMGSLETVRLIDRLMARTAVVLFVIALTTSALATLFPGGLTRWLLAHRRDVALAFVVAFALHLLAIAGFYGLDPKQFWSVSPPLLVGLRLVGVVFVGLMLLDLRSLVGPRAWATLNTVGAWYIWAAFLNGFVKRLGQGPVYPWLAALLLLVPLLRFTAALRRRTRPAAK